METTISTEQVSSNLQNLTDEERQLITQLNIPQFRDFMSKVFGADFGMLMQEAIPAPQVAQQPQQPVSQQSETPTPTQGEGMMTQPPSV
jgi:DNA replication initiation complex subunit (GINS family)